MEIFHQTYGQGVVMSSSETHHVVHFHSGAQMSVLKTECSTVIHS